MENRTVNWTSVTNLSESLRTESDRPELKEEFMSSLRLIKRLVTIFIVILTLVFAVSSNLAAEAKESFLNNKPKVQNLVEKTNGIYNKLLPQKGRAEHQNNSQASKPKPHPDRGDGRRE